MTVTEPFLSKRLWSYRQSSNRRWAFTLVELLVVIAIIGILVSLLLPAVQSAREAARRAQCLSHLKQIGLALHNYETSHQQFAPGWTEDNNADRSKRSPLFAWGAHILPYMEESALFDQFDFNVPANSGVPGGAVDNVDLIGTVLSIYRCPSTISQDTEAIAALGSFYPEIPRLAISNYVGSGSTCFLCLAGQLPDKLANGAEVGVPCPVNEFPIPRMHVRPNGILYRNSATAIRQIDDGTSKTFLVGERKFGEVLDRGSEQTFWSVASWAAPPGPVSHQLACFAARMTASTVYMNQLKAPMINGHIHGFNSEHPGGVQVVMADGSGRFVNQGIDQITVERLVRMADGQVVSDEF